jgi:NAD(P)-dependent dehydrogenase (short-subunit alcohol dehydrogenase family)
MANGSAIVIGASGGIGSAMYQRWQHDPEIDKVIAISRLYIPQEIIEDDNQQSCNSYFIRCDYSETSILESCERIQELTDCISRVCICNGILHKDNVWPEKRLEDLNAESLQEVFAINSVIPVLWLKALLPLLHGKNSCVISVLSARIGSISDNFSGGWYSYRASKAALNMLLKTASIEYARRAKNVKLIAFQPGTTDTHLSKPFQKSVKSKDLLQPDYVAQQLIEIMNAQQPDGKLSFLDWENKPIDW